MKFNLAQPGMVCHLILILAFAGLVTGQPTPTSNRTVEPQENSLRLPSFAIFGLPSSDETKNIEKPINAKELEKFVAGVEKARTSKGVTRAPNYYRTVPLIFYRARSLFAKATWTKEEIKQGLAISAFFARVFAKPELKIETADPESFKNGLRTLSNWFIALCQNNQTLGMMIYTEDQGPFFGEPVDGGRISELRLLESIEIPDHQARFVVMKEPNQLEPIIIGVVNDDSTVRWLRRYSAAPQGRITSATLVQRTLVQLEGYGYVCRFMADWNYGFEPSIIYLDDRLDLRFYFISW